MAILSMTGFGQSRLETEFGEFQIEIKSVNNRYCDVNVRLPREMSAQEIPLRERLKSSLRRGKVDCFIRWTPAESLEPELKIKRPLLEAYRREILLLQQDWGLSQEIPWRELLTLSGAVDIRPPEIDAEKIATFLEQALDEAIQAMIEGQRREGEALRKAVEEQIQIITRALATIEENRGEVVEHYRERLNKLFEDLRARLPEAVDANRMEAEVLLLADKADVTEETVRLGAHLEAFDKALNGDEDSDPGKRLEFLVQEILREINTIGSKCRNTTIASLVVDMKHALEKVREQLANVR